MYGKRLVTIIALALAGVAFLAVGAQATAYTWTGNTSNAWNDTSKLEGGSFSECLYRYGYNTLCYGTTLLQSLSAPPPCSEAAVPL